MCLFMHTLNTRRHHKLNRLCLRSPHRRSHNTKHLIYMAEMVLQSLLLRERQIRVWKMETRVIIANGWRAYQTHRFHSALTISALCRASVWLRKPEKLVFVLV